MKLLGAIDAKRIASGAGTVLMLAALFFVARRLMIMRYDLDFSILASPRMIIAFLLIVCIEGVGIILASINFRGLVANISGVLCSRSLAVKVYTVSNLYKYIPGGIMYVLGRNRLAIETKELSHGKVALATILEGAIFVVAAIMIAVAYAFDHSIRYIRQVDILSVAGLLLGLTALISVPIFYYFRHKLSVFFSNFKKSAEGFNFAAFVKRFAFALALVCLWAATFLITLMLLGQPMTTNLGFTIMGLYMLSWLAGLLTPGAPGGLGIREAVMLMFMSGILNERILLSAIVMHRVLNVAGDVAAYGMSFAFRYHRGR